MGYLMIIRRCFISLLIPLLLSGCTAVAAVTAIPAALFEVAANQFSGEEKSFPASMGRTLTAIQQTLWNMNLDVDVVEIQKDGGYGIGFGNERLDGEITLRKQTPKLTTVYVKVRATTREESVEHAITEMIEVKLKSMTKRSRFSTKRYNNLRAKANLKSAKLGWFKPGARLDVRKTNTEGWLRIKLPSGRTAFLKGAIIDDKEKKKHKIISSKTEK